MDEPDGAYAGERKAWLFLMKRASTLLQAEMSLVRAAAKFVFRAEPEIAREATSAYERRRRASAARKARKDKLEKTPAKDSVNSAAPA